MQGIKKLLEPKTLLYIGICYTLLLTFLLLFPTTDVPKPDLPNFDKLGHVVLFTFLVVIWALFAFSKTEENRSQIVRVMLLAFVYGIIIEVLQELFFQPRTGDGWDIVANSVGILLGWFVFQKVKRIFIPKA